MDAGSPPQPAGRFKPRLNFALSAGNAYLPDTIGTIYHYIKTVYYQRTHAEIR